MSEEQIEVEEEEKPSYWDYYTNDDLWDQYMAENEAKKTYRFPNTTSYEEDLANWRNGSPAAIAGFFAFMGILLVIAIIAFAFNAAT